MLLPLLLFLASVLSKPIISNIKSYEVVSIASDFFTRRQLSSVANPTAPFHLEFSFESFGQNFSISADQNTELFSPDYVEERVQFVNGKKIVIEKKTFHEIEKCHYRGTLSSNGATGKISLSACVRDRGIKGLFQIRGEQYAIEPAHRLLSREQLAEKRQLLRRTTPGFHENSAHVIFNTKDNKEFHGACGIDYVDPTHSNALFTGTAATTTHHHDVVHDLQHFVNPLAGIPASHLQANDYYVELLVVNDHERYTQVTVDTEQESATLVNFVNTLYHDNSFIPAVQVVLSSQITFIAADPWNVTWNTTENTVSPDALLESFRNWLGNPGNAPEFDNAHLFSGYDFRVPVLGLAYLGTMCQAELSCGIDHVDLGSLSVAYTAAIIAHEMGHNFGMSHDGHGNNCPESGNIMNAKIAQIPSEFSTCSKTYFQDVFVDADPARTCLNNYPTSVWGDPVCGNGFVEGDETCDCGPLPCAQVDPCCNGTSCQLLSSATCSNRDACCDNCTYSSNFKVCRPSAGSCDIEELCTGTSAQCPSDDYKGAGARCSDSYTQNGLCYAGQCKSYSRGCENDVKNFYTTLTEELLPCTNKEQEDQNGGNFCGNIHCAIEGIGCLTPFEDPRNNPPPVTYLGMPDGTPCPIGQCSAGTCVPSSALNPYRRWSVGPWSQEQNCTCGSTQTRSVYCLEVRCCGEKARVVNDYMCGENDRPAFSRLCVNDQLSCRPPSNPLDDAASEIAAKYGANEKAAQLRSLIPKHKEFNFTDDEYWADIKELAVPGGFLAGFCLVALLVFWIGRERCDSCGGQRPKPEGYSDVERWVPILIMLVFFIIVLIFVCIGLFFNGDMKYGVTDSQTGVLVLMVNTTNDAISLTSFLTIPLADISSTAETIADQTAVILGSNSLTDGVTPLLDDLQEFEDTYDDATVSVPARGNAPALNWNCVPCQQFSTVIPPIEQGLNQTAGDAVLELSSVANLAEAATSNLKSQIAIVDDALTETNGTYERLVATRPQVYEYRDQVDKYHGIYHPFVIVLLIIPLIALIFWLIAVFTKKGGYMHVVSILMGVTLVVMWALFGVSLPMAATFGDSCAFFDKAEIDPEQYLNWTATQAAIGRACLINASLVDALNLTDQFNFVNTLQFPSIATNITSEFDLTALLQLNTTIGSLTPADYSYSQSVLDDYFEELNTADPDPPVKTESNIDTYTPPPTNQAAIDATDKILVYIAARQAAQTQINEMQQSFSVIVNQAYGLRADAIKLQLDVNSAQGLMTPLITSINNFYDLAYCGSIGDAYSQFKTTWCKTLSTAIAFMALVTFMIAMSSVALVWISIVEEKRIGHPWVDGAQGAETPHRGTRGESRAASPSREAASSRAASPSRAAAGSTAGSPTREAASSRAASPSRAAATSRAASPSRVAADSDAAPQGIQMSEMS